MSVGSARIRRLASLRGHNRRSSPKSYRAPKPSVVSREMTIECRGIAHGLATSVSACSLPPARSISTGEVLDPDALAALPTNGWPFGGCERH
jgi:hypothetical protein